MSLNRTEKIRQLCVAADLAYTLRSSRAADIFLAVIAYTEGREEKDRAEIAKAYLAVQEAKEISFYLADNAGETTPISDFAVLDPCLAFLMTDARLSAGWVQPCQIA